jgi:hypothetical protein
MMQQVGVMNARLYISVSRGFKAFITVC